MADPALGQAQQYIREILCHGLLETGMGYIGLTVSDHSYRGSPAMRLLKMCFGMD